MSTDDLNLPALIKEIGRGARGARDLSRPQARTLFGAMLDGQVEDLQLGAIVLALRVKGESTDELLGFSDALSERTAVLPSPPGPRLVVLPALNGARKLLNLMPLLALHLAHQGVPVLIHGRRDFETTRSDTFALLHALGHPACTRIPQAEAALQQERIAVLPSALLAPGLERLMALRPRLGLRNSAHTLVKLLDPAPGRSLRVVAVTHGEFLERLGEVLPQQGSALLLKGCEGEAYPHPRRSPSLQAWVDGQALDFALGEPCEDPLWEQQGDAREDARRLLALLDSGPEAWPQRLREMADALCLASSYSK